MKTLLLRVLLSLPFLLALLFALSRFAVLLAAAGAVLAQVPRYRLWLTAQPGYIHVLSRWPGWRPPRFGRLTLATASYLFVASSVARAFVERGGLVAQGASDEMLLRLEQSVYGAALGLPGLLVIITWLTGSWIFSAGAPHRVRGRPYDALRWPEVSRQHLMQTFLGPWDRAKEQRIVTAAHHGLRRVPQAGTLASLVLLLLAAFGWLGYGALLAAVGIALSPVSAFQAWLRRQPGYRTRFSRIWGLGTRSPWRLSLMLLVYLALPSALFWQWRLADSAEWPSVGVVVVSGAFGTALLYGWLLRNWRLRLPEADLLRALQPGHRAWKRQLKVVDSLSASGRREAVLEEAWWLLKLSRSLFGPRDPRIATSLDRLGHLLARLDRPERAEPFLREALDLRRQLFGKEDSEVAESLGHLGAALLATGRLAGAEECYRELLIIHRLSAGVHSIECLETLQILGRLHLSIGNPALAELLLREALDVRRLVAGQRDPLIEQTLRALGQLYTETGEPSVALPYLAESERLCSEMYGKKHPRRAHSLSLLAGARAALGETGDAVRLYEESLSVAREALGENHPEVALIEMRAAFLFAAVCPETAERRFQRAIETFRAQPGSPPLSLGTALHGLGELLAAQGRTDEAFALFQEGIAVDDRVIRQVFSFASENQCLSFLQLHLDHMASCLGLIADRFASSPEALRFGFELVLRRKGLGTDLLAAQYRALRGDGDGPLAQRLQDFLRLELRLSRDALAGPGEEGSGVHARLLREGKVTRERLQAELARALPNVPAEVSEIRLDEVAGALPEGAALVEIVRARGANGDRSLAFVLSAGAPGALALVDLGDAEEIGRLVHRFRAAVTGAWEREGRHLRLDGDPSTSATSTPGHLLRARIFDPLLPHLQARTHLFLAPEGELTRLPFEALPLDDGSFLIDHCEISYVSTGRDLLVRGRTQDLSPGPPLVLADPDFDAGPAPAQSQERLFERLAATRREGETIAHLLGVRPHLGAEATKEVLWTSHSPEILHIATHGFFLEDRPAADGPLRAAATGVGALVGQENPLLRSGLALAGANRWLEGRRLPAGAEDGILNAVEVSCLDLRATELVVLSACETGLGEVRSGEGVFGLRRSFLLAGARTLVMSLWRVPDQPTQELMVDLYRRLLAGTACSTALRKAQLALRERHPHPLDWAGFVCLGDPRALSEDARQTARPAGGAVLYSRPDFAMNTAFRGLE